MTNDEFLDAWDAAEESGQESVTKPWKWGHSETITLPDGRKATGFFHCQEGLQNVQVSK